MHIYIYIYNVGDAGKDRPRTKPSRGIYNKQILSIRGPYRGHERYPHILINKSKDLPRLFMMGFFGIEHSKHINPPTLTSGIILRPNPEFELHTLAGLGSLRDEACINTQRVNRSHDLWATLLNA